MRVGQSSVCPVQPIHPFLFSSAGRTGEELVGLRRRLVLERGLYGARSFFASRLSDTKQSIFSSGMHVRDVPASAGVVHFLGVGLCWRTDQSNWTLSQVKHHNGCASGVPTLL
jgi:hypothetical protein